MIVKYSKKTNQEQNGKEKNNKEFSIRQQKNYTQPDCNESIKKPLLNNIWTLSSSTKNLENFVNDDVDAWRSAS